MFLGVILTGWIPIIGDLVGLILSSLSYIVDLHALVGIILSILVFCKVIQ